MTTVHNIRRSMELADQLSAKLHDLELPATLRTRLAAACFSAALDHHAAICMLFERGISSSALALLRPLFEAYIRGSWLFDCATDDQVERFKDGRKIPEIKKLIESLEEKEPFLGTDVLSTSHARSWNVLCGFAHSGVEIVMRNLTEDTVEGNCPDDEVLEALGFAEATACLSAMGIARIAEDGNLAERLLLLVKQTSHT